MASIPILRYFKPPVFDNDEQKTRLAANLNALIWVAILVIGMRLLLLPALPYALLGQCLILISMGSTLILIHRRVIHLAAVFCVVNLWLIIMPFALDTGGIRAAGFTGGGVLIVLIAGFLLTARQTLGFVVLNIVYGIFLAWVERSGLLPPVRDDFTLTSILTTQSGFLMGTAALVIINTNSLHRALRRMTAELHERKRVETALRTSEDRYRTLAENLPNSAIILFDADLRFILVDGPEVQNTGYSKANLEGKMLYEAVPAEFAAAVEANMRRVLAGEVFSADIPFNGQVHTYNYVPLRDEQGKIVLGMILARNVTEHKRLEAEVRRYTSQLEQMVEERTAELRAAKEQIEVIIDNTNDAIALVQNNGDVQLANPAFRHLFDDAAAAVIERVLWAVSEPETIETVAHRLLDTLYDQQHNTLATRVVSQDGSERDIDLAMIPIPANSHADTGMVLSAHDITQLKEIERLKQRFVADAVHDLSSPISGLSTRLYLLKKSPERMHDHIQSLENQVMHLRDLLEDLRMLSQLDQDNILIEKQPTNFAALLQRIFDTYEPLAIEKKQVMRLIIHDTPLTIELDRRQIERVLANLISNAIYYTPNEKAITVQARSESTSVIVEIADQGIGIDPESLERIFERFYRADKARVTRPGGTGLGLAIVREIVDMHGGTIEVKSEVNKGSTFTLRLPI